MLNNPLTYTDKNGDCPNCIAGGIGAIIGGIANLGIKAYRGQIHSFKDGAAAFGIGAVAGFVTGFTGGAASGALGLSAASFTGGAVAGAAGSITGGLVQGLGNAAYFNDPYSAKDWAMGVGVGTLTGGILGGVAGRIKGGPGSNWVWGEKGRPSWSTNVKQINGKTASISFGEAEFAGVDDYILNAEGVALKGEAPIIGQSSTFAGQTAKSYNFNGRFSITNWAGYPTAGNVPKPVGPFRILEGIEYETARNAANTANRGLRNANPSLYADKQIHEIVPVKFGGSPTDIANKIALEPSVHRQYNAFWLRIQNSIKR